MSINAAALRAPLLAAAATALSLVLALACPAAAQTTNPLSAIPGVAPAAPAPATSTPAAPAAPAAPPISITLPPVSAATGGTGSALPSTTPTAGPPPPVTVQYPPTNVTANDGISAPLFGTSLFTGAFAGSTIYMNPTYAIQVGDIIEVKTFGNLSLDVVARVNSDGKLFLPVVGPIPLVNVTRDKLNSVLQTALSAIYTNTQVYADIIQPGAIGVFVTGQVYRPGRYLGGPTDNLLYYLDKAGGIDGKRGSFRDVMVRHKDGREEHFDLYDFLLHGSVSPMKFSDGDVIIIRPRGPQVVVSGMAASNYAFELTPPPGVALNADIQSGLTGSVPAGGAQIVKLARPNERMVTSVYIASVRDQHTVASYKPYADFAQTALGDGDHVDFRSDTLSPTIKINLAANLDAPSVFIVPRNASLKEILAGVPIEGFNVDIQSVYVVRSSVAAQQKQLITTELLQLQEEASMPGNAIDAEQAQAQATTAALIPQFVSAASQVQPTGQIAIYRNGQFQDMHLQDGDQIVIPDKTDVVLVSGEVLAPGGFAHRDRAHIKDYIDDAGGYTDAANTDKFVLRRPNGSARLVDEDAIPQPGDAIMVVPKVNGMALQLVKDISTLVYQIAISAATVVALHP